MKWRARDATKWHLWWAWRPVETEDGWWVWLEYVWRQEIPIIGPARIWCYKLKGPKA